MNKLTIRFNASAAKESACLRRTWLTVIDGYAELVPNNDVVFGSALHEYVSQMRTTGGNYGIATQKALLVFNKPKKTKPKKDYLNDSKYFMLTCQSFWDDYLAQDDFVTLVNPADGKPLVELKFSIPYYADSDCEVYLEGTVDDLCKHTHGCYAVRDYKTTSVWDSKAYLESYALSPQLMFYRMAVEWYAQMYPQSIFSDMMKKGIIGSFIDGVFLLGKDKEPEFKRSEIFQFSDDKMQEFRTMLREQVMRLVNFAKLNTRPAREGMLNGACQTVYGACKFFHACNALDEVHAGHILNNNFIKKPYDPLNHDGEV